MGEKSGLKAMMPSKKEIGFMVIEGFGLFLTVTGMVGITFILGPLNHVLKDLEYTLLFDNTASAFFLCFGFCVIGGALDFVAKTALKSIEKQKAL
ncbi:MAG TPA: hypothetical protein G4O13_01725 [Dehalococcoidia bacterium]|nr:hypothetical protein [Dehalococcoidia bacterium]